MFFRKELSSITAEQEKLHLSLNWKSQSGHQVYELREELS